MENKSSSIKHWFILGGLLLITLVIYAILKRTELLHLSVGTETYLSGLLGWGGIIFIVIGITKAFSCRYRK